MRLNGRKIILRVVEEIDSAFILSLRVDETKNKFLSNVEADPDKQIEWVRSYKLRELAGDEYYFIITSLDGESCGTVRLYDFQGDSFCWGSWLIKNGSPPSAGIESALLVYELAFYQLGFSRSHFDVRSDNVKVRAFHERMGAQRLRENELECHYTYSKITYEKIRSKYSKYLPA